ncbi:Nucleotide-binding universal stress protein, UspA family [Flavobacterium anhuiense]|uniref:Nucleotide-binding universal stress protein, UspA family n=1 Tax=Flavobacterium anhuiense TaxID=459526 RepID=A0ABY0LXB9_9FLAO|nr:universal stress protein [Flavobacterium anhuiense]SCY75768.1 Nucleotide-binding universal stress protein, UspA family [Flavobacterium anhuiense]
MNSQLTIIAATNYSETASNAVAYAAGFAKSIGAKLVLFNAFSLSVHSANSRISASGMEKELDKAVSKLKTLSKETAEVFEIEVNWHCSYSFLEDELLSLINATKAYLIVMGMADRSFEQDLLGNTTTSVIKKINFPVLAVPKNARFQGLKKVLFACDSLGWSTTKKLSWIEPLVGNIETVIEFFSVDESVSEIQQKNKENLTIVKEIEIEKHIYKTVRSNDVISEIKKEIIKYNADILVMVPRIYGFWDSLVHTSKTRIMASGLEIPLLAFPNY